MSLNKNDKNLGEKALNIHQELIDACFENNQKAQFDIYKLYYKAMYNCAFRIINNQMEAEDVMQEAFLDAFRKINQYDGTATFGAWLKRIVINKSIDSLKKSKNMESLETVEKEITELDDEDYLEVISYKIDEIQKCMDELPEAYKIVLSLYLIEGYDHQEIAEIMDISYNATRTKYSRARQKLLLLLKKSNITNTVNLN